MRSTLRRTVVLASVLLASTDAVQAQTPYYPRPDIFVTDTSNDRVTFVADLGGDGAYTEATDAVVFYDGIGGPFMLSNNNGIASGRDGAVYVADSSTDIVVRLQDLDGNGTAFGVLESTLFFASLVNPAGIEMLSAGGMDIDGDVVWIAVTQTGSTGKDYILRLEDLNNDGDAMDNNEALEYCVRHDLSTGGASNRSLPQDVHVGLDGNVYYLEVGAAGFYTKGIYKLVDVDNNGTVDPVTEVFDFFLPPAQTNQPFFWTIEQAADGAWYMADTGNEFIWRAFDTNGSGLIDAGEYVKWWTAPGASLIWSVRMGVDGWLYVGESQNNERIYAMKDLDGSGTIDQPNEQVLLHDELTSLGAPIGQLRGFVLDRRMQEPSETYCTSQPSAIGCVGAISDLGTPSATFGSGYYIQASNMRNAKSGLMFYGTTGRDAAPFGGGTMCVASPRIRTPLQISGGSPFGDDCTGSYSFDFNAYIATNPNPALVVGATVDAQYWSRDPGSPPSNTNLTDALEFTILR